MNIHLKVNLISFILIAFTFMSCYALTPQKPDFAFPKIVSQQSEKQLSNALKNHNSQGIVRSLMDYYLAQVAIDTDNISAALSKINEINENETDSTLKSVLYLLQANIYKSIYYENRWKYDERSLPLSPLPDDYNQWSGDQFRHKIVSLIDASLALSGDLKNVPLKDYNSIVTADKQTYIYYPTLYDFIASNCIELLNGLSISSRTLSWGLLVPSNLYIVSPFPKTDPIVNKILGLYASLLKANEGRTAAEINTDLERINFIYQRVYSPTNSLRSDYYSDNSRNSSSDKLFALLQSLYEENKGSEFSGDILNFMGDNCEDTDEKWLYSAIEYNLKKYPTYWRNDCLKNIKKQLSQKEVTVNCPMVVAPDKTTEISVSVKNVNTLRLDIYEVATPLWENDINLTNEKHLEPSDSIIVEFSGKTPFSDKATVQYIFPHVGNFIIVPTVNGTKDRNDYYTKVYVTHFAIASSQLSTTNLVLVDAASGVPVSDASISIIDRNNRHDKQRRIIPCGLTNADGMIKINDSGLYIAEKNGDRYALPTYIYTIGSRENDREWVKSIAGYTSLPLYHPGDTVEWTAVMYEYNKTEQRLCTNKEVLVHLLDASYQTVDSLLTRTDNYGRTNGSFVIPKDCLTGIFNIRISSIGNISFKVSDYKLPTYKVILDPVEKDFPNRGDVTIRGKAVTYSGFPLSDTKITADISVSERLRWWNRASGVSFASEETVTGPDGKFEISIDSATLATAPIPQGVFNVQISATSTSGESQSASTTFMTGTKYQIQVSMPDAIEMSKETVAINAKVVNYLDSVIELPIKYSVTRNDETLLTGVMPSNNRFINLSSFKSGKYTFKFGLEDKNLADEISESVVVYRNTDNATPLPEKLLWYPTTSVTTEVNGHGRWLYATNCDTYFLLTLWHGDSVLSQKWEKIEAGMRYLDIQLPLGIDEAKLTVACTGNYKSAETTLSVKCDVARKGIRFITESFRDHIIPGREEIWKFKVIDESGNGTEAAVILDMYNTALDALASSNWNIYFNNYSRRRYSWSNSSLSNTIDGYYRFGVVRYANCPQISEPSFNTYGFGFSALKNYFLSKAMRKGSMLMAESADMEEETAVMSDYAAPMMSSKATMETIAAADSGSGTNDTSDESKQKTEEAFQYRDAETPLAFFAPQLITEPDGSLSFTFTVPNANTTWGFRALAYTDSLLATNFAANVMANKPVMVQPNLPRFLRSGDKAVIAAMVMNYTADTQQVNTIIELFNPNNDEIIGKTEAIDTISPNSSTVVNIEITAPDDAPFVGLRVKSSTANFADGEQTLLPILPATTPVIETYPFYISPDSTEFSMRLPKAPNEAKITLQYCDNPIWYVVTALPGILQLDPSTANEAGASIFSAAIAEGLMRDNPVIAKALKEWENSDKSSETLTSMLQRNEDLKIVLLSASPWMLNAKNDTERMARLSLIFDKNTIEKTYSKAVNLLSRLERDGGGWAWYSENTHPSQWATENILLMMGRLYQLNYLPDNKRLNSMILDAIQYLDKEAKNTYKKYPKSDFTSYVYMRDFFKNYTSKHGATDVINATIQRIVKDWKNGSIFDKAVYAKILVNHNYPSMAKTILSSLRQYSKSTTEKGMWWPQLDNMTIWSMGKVGTTSIILDAFAAVEPDCKDIDLIRQWLILQKEAMDWGTSVTTTEVIASILKTSKSWISPAKPAKVYVNNEEVQPGSVDKITGYFRTPLFNLSAVVDNSLRVDKEGTSPSWGAVYYQYTDSMTNVKASSTDAVSIDKTVYLITTKSDGSRTIMPDTLKVGDKIKVQLTVKVSRDMDYVAIIDDRPACFESVEQLPKPIFTEGIYFYRENRNSSTRFFIDYLPKGTYLLTYEMWVNSSGEYTSGIATIQSQYAPQLSAHSSGNMISVF